MAYFPLNVTSFLRCVIAVTAMTNIAYFHAIKKLHLCCNLENTGSDNCSDIAHHFDMQRYLFLFFLLFAPFKNCLHFWIWVKF